MSRQPELSPLLNGDPGRPGSYFPDPPCCNQCNRRQMREGMTGAPSFDKKRRPKVEKAKKPQKKE